MKKLTLEQALKTPNIAFDVTPEQVNEINHITDRKLPEECVAVRTEKDCHIEFVNYKHKVVYTEIYLPILVEIIEEDNLTFNSQQEVWQWLVEGNKCNYKSQWEKCNWVIGFKEGTLWNYTLYREFDCRSSPDMNVHEWTKYKEPEYITVNGFQVPKPITDLPNLGKPGINNTVYVVSLSPEFHFAIGEGNSYTRFFFKNGLCHFTKEAAIIHAKAMLGIKE